MTASLLSDIYIPLYKKTALESRVGWTFWLSYVLFLQEERCLTPSLAQLVKAGDVEQEEKLTGGRGTTAVCHLTPVTGKKASSGKLILKQVFKQRV